jgi:hypothetical protein
MKIVREIVCLYVQDLERLVVHQPFSNTLGRVSAELIPLKLKFLQRVVGLQMIDKFLTFLVLNPLAR